LKKQLGGSDCDQWYTVFVPDQAQWRNANAATASNHVIKGLWCTQGLISKASDTLATMSGDVIQLGCSGRNRDRITVMANGRSAQIDSAERGRSFDRMASNGVVHVISGQLTPRSGTSLRIAVQFDATDAVDSQLDLFNEFEACNIAFESTKKYILLVPTVKAMKKFHKYRSSKAESQKYLKSQDFRCQVLRYHILIAEDGLTDLERVMHLQKSYKTLLHPSARVTDFLVTDGQKLSIYFMHAKASKDRAFEHGHIYQIDQLLLPASTNRWSSVLAAGHKLPMTIRSSLHARLRNLALMEAAAPAGVHCTHFVPPGLGASEALLIQHSSRYVLWTNYLRVGNTLELPPCSGADAANKKLLLRRISHKTFQLGSVDSRFKVLVQHANILRPTGMVWFIERALV